MLVLLSTKLMLMELYEVEAKHGGRCDHVASRGVAMRRRESIAKLPGNPFQIILNFQQKTIKFRMIGNPPRHRKRLS